MFQIWKINTLVFGLQLLAGWLTYRQTGDLVAVSGAALAISTICILLTVNSRNKDGSPMAAVYAAIFASIAFLFASVRNHNFATIAAFLVVVVAATFFALCAAYPEEDSEPREKRFWLFLAALPAGIGTVLGGLGLLYLFGRSCLSALSNPDPTEYRR